jgi:hypothetical protein
MDDYKEKLYESFIELKKDAKDFYSKDFFLEEKEFSFFTKKHGYYLDEEMYKYFFPYLNEMKYYLFYHVERKNAGDLEKYVIQFQTLNGEHRMRLTLKINEDDKSYYVYVSKLNRMFGEDYSRFTYSKDEYEWMFYLKEKLIQFFKEKSVFKTILLFEKWTEIKEYDAFPDKYKIEIIYGKLAMK